MANHIIKVLDGKVVECSAHNLEVDCIPLPEPQGLAKAQSVYIADDEIFALYESADQRTVLTHHQTPTQKWDFFSFDYQDYCNTVHGFCTTVYRHPVVLSDEDHYLMVQLSNGEVIRAKIFKGEMRFEPHSQQIKSNTVYEGLLEIGTFSKVLGYNDSSPDLHDRWEKSRPLSF